MKLWSLAAKGQIVPDRSLLKTPEQIAAIRKSADLNTAVLDHVAAHIHAGMSTAEIDKLVYDFTTEHGGIPAPLNYEGFPKSVCTSINNVICHGKVTLVLAPYENVYGFWFFSGRSLLRSAVYSIEPFNENSNQSFR